MGSELFVTGTVGQGPLHAKTDSITDFNSALLFFFFFLTVFPFSFKFYQEVLNLLKRLAWERPHCLHSRPHGFDTACAGVQAA